MRAFTLKIVTPDGLRFEGPAEEVVLRTTTGDMGILAGHINTVAPLGMGMATFLIGGKKRYAACIGGMVSVVDNTVSIIATSFEWSDQIDVERALRAEKRAREVLANSSGAPDAVELAQARLKRALIRKSVANK